MTATTKHTRGFWMGFVRAHPVWVALAVVLALIVFMLFWFGVFGAGSTDDDGASDAISVLTL